MKAIGTSNDHHFWHKVNGRFYTTVGMPEITSLDQYKQQVRDAYGSLYGITFGMAR